HGIVGRASPYHVGQSGIVAPDLRGRRPGGPDILAVDPCLPEPLLAGPADGDPVAQGGAVAAHEVEPALRSLDDDGARRDTALEGHDLAGRCIGRPKADKTETDGKKKPVHCALRSRPSCTGVRRRMKGYGSRLSLRSP